MRRVNSCAMRRRFLPETQSPCDWLKEDSVHGSNGSKPRINMRQRIVINLDEPKAGGAKPIRKRRRWPRVLAILALLVFLGVVVAAVGGYLWWRHYQTTPAYTLTLLFDAAQRNDLAEFQKYINDDEIAKNMMASVSQKAAGRYGVAINSSIQQQIDGLMSAMLPRLKQTVHDEVV